MSLVQFARFHQAHEIDLHGRTCLCDLIEKDSAAVCFLQESFSIFVSEEFRFNQLRRDRGAVDYNKRLIAAVAMMMDGGSHELLTCARLARQQNR